MTKAAKSFANFDTLPDGWRRAKLGEVSKTTSGGTPSRKNAEYFTGDIPWVKSGELPDGIVTDVEERITEDAVANSSAKLFPAGTLLIALYGATVGKLGILKEDATTNQAVCAIFPHEDIDTKYLFWYLRFVRSDLVAQAVGGAQPNISQGILRELQVPIAPRNQQKRIVEEIEKQFSRLDEAVANLKRVKSNLKRYKASVLKAAVEGKLVETEAELARRECRSYETGEELLQRILKERREKWTGRGKYKEPAAPDITDLPELPEGWVWATVEQIAAELMNGYGKRSQVGGTPQVVLRLADIVDGEISFANVRKINCTADEVDKYGLQANDLLVLRVNGSPDLVGRFVFVHQTPEIALYCDHFIRARCVTSDMAIWLRNYSDVERCRRYIDLNKVSSAGQNTINQGALSQMAIPLPPVSEQHRIVAEVDRRLSLLRETEAQVDANLQRAERLRQAILGKSFSYGFPKGNDSAIVNPGFTSCQQCDQQGDSL